MRVEYPEGEDALTEFILFADRVYAYRSARWPASVDMSLPLLTGRSADCQDRTLKPLMVREHGEIVARAVAALDGRYNRHWNERLGHIIMFEAMPDSREAVKLLRLKYSVISLRPGSWIPRCWRTEVPIRSGCCWSSPN